MFSIQNRGQMSTENKIRKNIVKAILISIVLAFFMLTGALLFFGWIGAAIALGIFLYFTSRNKKRHELSELEYENQKRNLEFKGKSMKEPVYDYYCRYCLFQTNDFSSVCPKCDKGDLTQTSKNNS